MSSRCVTLRLEWMVVRKKQWPEQTWQLQPRNVACANHTSMSSTDNEDRSERIILRCEKLVGRLRRRSRRSHGPRPQSALPCVWGSLCPNGFPPGLSDPVSSPPSCLPRIGARSITRLCRFRQKKLRCVPFLNQAKRSLAGMVTIVTLPNRARL